MVIAISLALAAAPAGICETEPAAAQRADRVEELHEQAPEAFWKRPALKEEIDFDKIDRALLDAAVFHETNRRRAKHDLPPLKFRPKLREAARLQARAMVKLGKVTHENPAKNEKMPSDRMKLLGLDGHYYAENVAMVFGIRYKSGEQVYPRELEGREVFSKKPGGKPIQPHSYASFAKYLLDEWMASPGHRKNILSKEPEFLGVSCLHDRPATDMDRFYCAQEFYAPFSR